MDIGKAQAKAIARFLELAAERADHIRLNVFYRPLEEGDTAFLQALDENGEELARMVVDEWLKDFVDYSGKWKLDEVVKR